MSINSILNIVPESWHEHIEPSEDSENRTKYRFTKGRKNFALHGHTGEPEVSRSVTQVIEGDMPQADGKISFINLGEEGFGGLTTRISANVLDVVDLINSLSVTNRFAKCDTTQTREVNSRDAEVGLVYAHHQCNILDLVAIIGELGYKLTDMSHMLALVHLPQVRQAIEHRFRQAKVGQVNVGCLLPTGTRTLFADAQRGIKMTIAQLRYGPKVVELDVTYPKPRGEGYQPGHALWAVQKI